MLKLAALVLLIASAIALVFAIFDLAYGEDDNYPWDGVA